MRSVTSKGAFLRVFSLQLACVFLGTVAFIGYALSEFVPSVAILLITATSLSGFILLLAVLASKLANKGEAVKALVITLLVVLLDGYIVLSVVVTAYQDKITQDLAPFFQPQALSTDADYLNYPGVEALDLQTNDGVHLRGWLVRNTSSEQSPLLIFFDGSGAEASRMIPYMKRLEGWSVALVNYRGFGLSDGVPTERLAYADAVFLYDTFAERKDIDAKHIIAMGYSLGTGIAVFLAHQRDIAGIVLAAPYDYVTLIGLQRPIVFLPLSGVLTRYFNSAARAPEINSPLLCLVGLLDIAVPPHRSFNLANAWGGEVTLKTYPGEGHNLLMKNEQVWEDIELFLQGYLQSKSLHTK